MSDVINGEPVPDRCESKWKSEGGNSIASLQCTKDKGHEEKDPDHHNPLAIPKTWRDGPKVEVNVVQQIGPSVDGEIVGRPPHNRHVDDPCQICQVKFVEGDVVTTVPTDKGTLVSHSRCFWSTRANTYEQLYNQAWQLLAGVAAQHGILKVRQQDLQKAARVEFQMDIRPGPDGVMVRLVTPLIEIPTGFNQ